MRDINRIYEVMALITIIWERQPDTRFNQLIHNLQWQYAEEKGAYKETLYKDEQGCGMVEHPVVDLFYVEDDEFVKFLRNKIDDWSVDGEEL